MKCKNKCDCGNHYLELCTAFDGVIFTYQRCCTSCGKWWTATLRTKQQVTLVSDYVFQTKSEMKKFLKQHQEWQVLNTIDMAGLYIAQVQKQVIV